MDLNLHRARQLAPAAVALLAVAGLAEWLRDPAPIWGAALGLLALIGWVAGWREGWRGRLLALVVTLAAAAIGRGTATLHRVQQDWPAERERRVSVAFRGLAGELRGALRQTDRLAAQAAEVAEVPRAEAFPLLLRALPEDAAEMAVVVLEPTGVPYAWAGRHRLPPEADGDSLGARFSRFYTVLESRRHSGAGRVVVASLLLWADSAAPRPDRSLAARFGARAGVQLRVFAPGLAPAAPDIFDYAEPTTGGDRTLFSLQPVPPDQASVVTAASEAALFLPAVALVLLVLAGLIASRTPGTHLGLLGVALWAAARAPVGAALGFGDLFSPATFSSRVLGPLSASAGHLALTAAVVLVGAFLRRAPQPRPRWWTLVAGSLLVVGAPYLVSELGRGIAPPASGVSTGLWLTWQVTLTLATTAVIVLAAALFGGERDGRTGWGPWVGALLAVAAAAIGLVAWQPRSGWPAWYPFLWSPALFLVARRAPRWRTLLATALVAGSAAALVTWGAELDARLVAAERDLTRLGNADDPLAVPLLERLGEAVRLGPEPAATSALYAAWRVSDLAGQEFPVRLALWTAQGSRQAELGLDSLDLPTRLIAALVREMDVTSARSVLPLLRVPGMHYLLLQRLPSGAIFSAAIGPRTRLLAPTRLARLLRPPAEGAPLYDMALSPPYGVELPHGPASRWSRQEWQARVERIIPLPGGDRHVHAVVDLRRPTPLLVRGALLILVDLSVLALFWGLALARPGRIRPAPVLRRLARAFQTRLAMALALFFVVPAAGFAVWAFGRLDDESARSRDLVITQVLRDAVRSAGNLLQEPAGYLAEGVRDLSNRLEADLVLYRGGRLVATSEPILAELALVDPLLDARAFQRLALGDELELTRPGTTYVAPVRVGYRVAQPGPPGGIGILANLQLADDWVRSRDQRDLEFLLLVAIIGGVAAAMFGAQLAARGLSRPVADLRRSAAAIGQGMPLPAVAAPPTEFEEVFTAFAGMASDVRASQAALESARQRTAAVLANVATGVVALERDGTVLLANARARQLLEDGLDEGVALGEALGPGWRPLVDAVDRFLAGSLPDATAEVDSAGREFRLQLARLGRPPAGVVLALDDVTDLTRAARVLAWGEMARQVAHEIKNPLTPIRLGIEHLKRVRRERPERFDVTLDETAARILEEIDRLDTIARAFSRFGLPGSQQAPLEPVDLGAAAREVAGLYRLAADGVVVEVESDQAHRRPARRDEVKEVVGNLLENARTAGARRIVITIDPRGFRVTDDGRGIARELLPQIFEPRFSSTTSGAGLGLPIVRRLAEGWGASVQVASDPGLGTTVSICWPADC